VRVRVIGVASDIETRDVPAAVRAAARPQYALTDNRKGLNGSALTLFETCLPLVSFVDVAKPPPARNGS
jgi:hypothetical protein